jgi:hypothetical protein
MADNSQNKGSSRSKSLSTQKAITIVQIAKMAGVSAQTVSYVLNNHPKASISALTRQRVIEIATREGYKPNRLAQAMKSGKSMIIGFAAPFSPGTPGPSVQMFRSIYDRANTLGYEILAQPLDGKVNEGWPVDCRIVFDPSGRIEPELGQTSPPTIVISPRPTANVRMDMNGGMIDLAREIVASKLKVTALVFEPEEEWESDLVCRAAGSANLFLEAIPTTELGRVKADDGIVLALSDAVARKILEAYPGAKIFSIEGNLPTLDRFTWPIDSLGESAWKCFLDLEESSGAAPKLRAITPKITWL